MSKITPQRSPGPFYRKGDKIHTADGESLARLEYPEDDGPHWVKCLNACETLADPSVIPLLIQIARMAQNREMNDLKLTAMNLLADEAMKKVEGK